MIYASLGLMGVGAFIILPSALELSVETTFPVPAGMDQKIQILMFS